jgi:16S rRNA (adenine1518-N6/adenine1519-N6)-dimethyltransferase
VDRKVTNRIAPFAKKSLGQNFLVDQGYIQRIIDAARLTADDTVLEIGPGRGALTRKLIKTGAHVVAIELDAGLIPVLEQQFLEHDNFELIKADVLKTDLSRFEIEGRKLKLVANLPYYISTAVLQHLIEHRRHLSDMILMFQREVVDRIAAEPGNSERGFLTVLVEAFLSVEKLFDVPPSAFKPSPRVWSSVVRLVPKDVNGALHGKENQFERLVSAAFRQKRKTILNNLKASAEQLKITEPGKLLSNADIEPTRRAETLTSEEWTRLFSHYAA